MGENSEEGGAPAKLDLWTPYRDLYHKINRLLYTESQDAKLEDFQSLLAKHKQNFTCLLQNPPKNTKSRDELKKGMEDGITMKEIGHQILSRDLYQEAVILSDMYDLNEFVALDLLCTAQAQMQYHPGLPRGLVAVLLYYEGRKFVVDSLKLLVHARKGVLWRMNVSAEFETAATSFTDQLQDAGLFNRIFELLRTLDLPKELEKLTENVALGGPKHRRQVAGSFVEIRECLAEVVFLWAAQSGLKREQAISLVGFLRVTKPEEDAAGVVDKAAVYLLLAVLYAFDLSILYFREDGEEVVQRLPIVSDKEFVVAVSSEVRKTSWSDKGLESTVALGLAVTISALRIIPDYQEASIATSEQKTLVDNALGNRVFSYLTAKVLPNPAISGDEVVMRRFHYLFTDFIVYMFSEINDMQVRTEELERTNQAYVHEGLRPPVGLPSHFDQFMACLTKFYASDPLNLNYCNEFWLPGELSNSIKLPSRNFALYKFVKTSATTSTCGTSFVTFVNMLSSLANRPQAARHCFNWLKQGGNKILSWDHFFGCFSQYYNSLKQEIVVQSDTVYRRFQPKGIAVQEVDGLLSVLKLITVIADQDDFCRLAFCEHPIWAPLTVFLGLVGCSVPIYFKSGLIAALAALSKSPEIAGQMWNYVESAQIVQTIPSASRYQLRGIETELEEVESRLEEYPLTLSFLKLLDVLTDSGIPRSLGAGLRPPGFDPYLNYALGVFVKFPSRSYKDQDERWRVACACLQLFVKLLDGYDGTPKTAAETSSPGFRLTSLLNAKSEFLALVLFVLDDGRKLFGRKLIETCVLACLGVVERALVLQAKSDHASANLVRLLLMNNPRTGRPDHLITIAGYVDLDLPVEHAVKAVGILKLAVEAPANHAQFLDVLTTFDTAGAVRDGFVQSLDSGNVEVRLAVLDLLKRTVAHATPNLAQYLLGFQLHDVPGTVFQPAGILGFPRTLLHCVFAIVNRRRSPPVDHRHPELEVAYEIVYRLYSNPKTCEPTLRFARLTPDFFKCHLDRLTSATDVHLPHLAWLLRALSIDLKVGCDKRQIAYVTRLVDALTTRNRPSNLYNIFNAVARCYDQAKSVNFLESIRQVVQVVGLYVPSEVASPAVQYATSVNLLRTILPVAVKLPLSPDDANYLSASVLVLMRNVRRSMKADEMETPVDLAEIFGYLLRWLVASDAGCQNLRINLYVGVITFVRVAFPEDPQLVEHGACYVSRLNASRAQVVRNPLAHRIREQVSGERLIELICQDCVGGHDVAKMLSMLTFSLLLDTNGDNAWIGFIAGRGYLRYIIDGILKSDDELKRLLEPSLENLRVMYLYKAKMSLLLRVASTKTGAECLLDHKTFACLGNLTVLNLHPETVKQTQVGVGDLADFVPPVELRYLEVFLPTLELANVVLTTLTADNYSAVTQIMDFLVSQLGPIEFALRCGDSTLSEDFLRELAVVTCTLSLVSSANVASVARIQETFSNYAGPMVRLQKHTLALLGKFNINDATVHELLASPTQHVGFQTSSRLLYALEIVSNVFGYLRNTIANTPGLVFKPTLAFNHVDETVCTPTIGTLVQHLTDFVTYYHQAKNTCAFLKIKVNAIPTMQHADLADLVKVDCVDIEVLRSKAERFVADKLASKDKELAYAGYVIDNALYLLWVHLDHYMLQTLPRIRHGETVDGMSYKSDLTGAEASWNVVSLGDVNNLKQGLVPVFNDAFSRQLLETAQDSNEVKRQFVEMLLRKIKRLLQFVPVTQGI